MIPPDTEEQEDVVQDAQNQSVMLHTTNWEFQPSVIHLKQGVPAALHVMGIEGNHGIASPELGIHESIDAGESKIITVPTDTPGTFVFFCNVPCGPGHREMRGTIVIE